MWDAVSGVYHTTLSGHTARVQVVWVDTDGLKLISASEDRTIKVWDAPARACVSTLELGGGGGVGSMAVSGGRLFSSMVTTVELRDMGSII